MKLSGSIPPRLLASLAALALVFVAVPSAQAAEHSGVTLPDSISAGGADLVLNGIGLRKKLVFKVYVAGFYLPAKTTDGAAAVKSSPKAMKMHMLMGLSGEKLGESIADGFKKSAGDKLPALQERIDKLKALFPSAAKGEEITLTHVPGTGTVITKGSETIATIEGDDFADAMFAIWLGSNPADSGLKGDLLGG